VEKNQEMSGNAGLRVGTRTDVGLRRQRNEDYLSVNETRHGLLLVVCDGMGGHVGGERASRLAVQQFVEAFEGGEGEPRALFGAAVERANAAVYRESTTVSEYSGMGTTLVAALVRAGHATIVNVGDSRAYRWHSGALERVSADHSVVEELVAAGRITAEQARVHPQRNLITRALGTTERVEADFFDVPFGDGDAILLASDGLHGMITDEQIGGILRTSASPDEACDRLVASALEAGGDDNVTVALVRSGVDGASLAGPLTDPGASRAHAHTPARGGSAWLWIVLALVVAAAVWVLLFARPWERADNLAPDMPPSTIDVDTSLSGVDSVLLDSMTQATPLDQLRGDDSARSYIPIDTLSAPDSIIRRQHLDSLPRNDAVTGRR
jgi:PPM family protein phosphatase